MTTLLDRTVKNDTMSSERPALPKWLRGTLVAIFVLAVAALYNFSPSRTFDPLSRINVPFRTSEARLSAFAHVPYRVLRSDDAKRDLSIDAAIVELKKRIGSGRDTSDLHRLALAQLTAGNNDEAAALLVEAASLEPRSVPILSDLAAADLAAGRIYDAAERSARALQLDPAYVPAAFNWALALERLSNTEEAIEAWQRYLRLDSDSGWAAEATQRLERLCRPRPQWKEEQQVLRRAQDPTVIHQLVERYPQRIRAWVQSEILPAWLTSEDPNDLKLMREIARARASIGDPLLLDIVDHTTRAPAQVRPAFESYVAANEAMANRDIETATARFSDAALLFARAESPMAFVAELGAATHEYYAGRSREALARLNALDDRLASIGNRYPSIIAESGWSRALVMGRLGEWNDSLRACERALEAAGRARESEHELTLVGGRAAILDRLGEPAQAEQTRIDLLRKLDEIQPGLDRTYVIYAETTWAALRSGRPRLALAFIAPQRRIAASTKVALYVAESEAKRALALRDIGQLGEAAKAAEIAKTAAMTIASVGLRDRTLAQIEFIRGVLDLDVKPERAIESFTSALTIWDSYGWRISSVTARTKRGQSHLRNGDHAAAEADFRAAIEQIEHERGTLDEPQLRVAYFERADEAFDRLIELLLAHDRTGEALSIVERKRSRALLDQIAGRDALTTAAPLSAEGIAAGITPGVTLVEISLLSRSTAIWMVHENRITFASTAAGRDSVEAAVKRHLTAIAANDLPAIRHEGQWLYEQLIAPIASGLRQSKSIVFVADGALQTLPFAAMVIPDGRYLIEQYAIAAAPSATIFVATHDPKTTAPTSVLAVAQPMPPGMEYLPNAASEVQDSAKLYPRGRTFIGREITPAEFLSNAGKADVVYFAGHTRVDTQKPSHSALLFEPRSERGPSMLTAAEVAASEIRTHPLVVLSACSTGRGRMRKNEGVDSLATAFLQAGARGVVATLWDVEDGASAEMFRSFHRNLRAGARTADALRNAQLSMLHGQSSEKRAPSAWASALTIGSL